ncbi:MAG: hypothetical protein LQ342_004293 [Letrouitia transgressa]|nr:MAG: hypothetical protein LQ342_004293 [Letrouitia transgressa]
MKFLLSASIGLFVPSVVGIGIPQEDPHHAIAARGHQARQYLPANRFTNMGHGPVVQPHPSVTRVTAVPGLSGSGGTPTGAGPDYTPPPTDDGYGGIPGGLPTAAPSGYGSNHTGATQILEINAQQYTEGGQKYIEVTLNTGEELTLTFEVAPNGTLRRVPGTGESGCSATAGETGGDYMSALSMVMGVSTDGGYANRASTGAESAPPTSETAPGGSYAKRDQSARRVLKRRHVWWSF